MKKPNSVVITLLFIMAGSVFLRLYKIGDKPVWYDETVSISHAEKPLSFYLFSPRVNYKPVYFFLLNRWLYLCGEDVWYLRFFSLLCGVANIFLLYKLAREMYSTPVGLTSAFLLGISVFHIFQCQQIRQFSFIALLATASIYYLVKFYKTGKVSNAWILASVNILLVNTHPTGFLVVLAEGIFAALRLRGRLFFAWAVSHVPLVLFIAAWFFIMDKKHIREMTWWIDKPGLAAMAETFNTLSWGGPRYGLGDFKIPLPWPWLLWLFSSGYFVLILLGLKGGASLGRKEDRHAGTLLVLWLVVPVLASYACSWLSGFSVYAIKHLIIVLPAFCILAARGVSGLRPKGGSAAILLVCVLSFPPLSIMYNNYFSSDWKGSTKYVVRSIQEGDAVVISSLSEVITFMFYFDRKKHTLGDIDIYGRITPASYKNSVFLAGKNNLIIGIKQTELGDASVSAESDFQEKVMRDASLKQKRVWTMISRWASGGVEPLMLAYFGNNFRKVSCRDFQGVKVCCFDPLPPVNK